MANFLATNALETAISVTKSIAIRFSDQFYCFSDPKVGRYLLIFSYIKQSIKKTQNMKHVSWNAKHNNTKH